MDCIPPSSSVLVSTTFPLRPASCVHQHSPFVQRLSFIYIPLSSSTLFPVSSKKIKKGVDRTGKVV